jgi:hypothetical protein
VPPWTKRCRPQRATPKRKRGAGRSSAGPICHLGRGAWHSDRPWLWPCLATSCYYMEVSSNGGTQKWMVWNGKSCIKMNDWEVPPF